MSNLAPTYAYEDDKVFAILDGEVIASGDNVSDIEEKVSEYTKSLDKERRRKSATHIITPNGLKGEILNRLNGTWGEEVTVRFENNHIATFHVGGNEEYLTEKVASTDNPIQRFSTKLDEDYDHDRISLKKRLGELDQIKSDVVEYLEKGSSFSDERELNRLHVAAENEIKEINSVLAHLDSEDIEPYSPPKFAAVEQASLGRAADDSWLDVIANDMIHEAQGIDYDRFITEGPALFTVELETGTLASAGSTRELAVNHVTAKTAAYVGDDVDDYRNKFVARVEVARRKELADRKSNMKREAQEKHEEVHSIDESLFL